MSLCPECGLDNDPSVVFCVSCGLFLEWEEDVVANQSVAQDAPGDPGLPDEKDTDEPAARVTADGSDEAVATDEGDGVDEPDRDVDDTLDFRLGQSGPGTSGGGTSTLVEREQRRGLLRSVLDNLRGDVDGEGWVPAYPAPPESGVGTDEGPEGDATTAEHASGTDVADNDPGEYDEDGDPRPVLPPTMEADPGLAVPAPPPVLPRDVAPIPPGQRRQAATVPLPPGMATGVASAHAARLIVPLGENDMPTPLAQRKRRVRPVVTDTAVEASQELGARAPGQQRERTGTTSRVTPPSRQVEPGDVICMHCGEANIPTRHFCRRCAVAMATVAVEPQVPQPWWRRFFKVKEPEEFYAGDRPDGGRAAGDPRWRIIWRRIKRIGRAGFRWAMAIILVSALIVPFIPAAQPFRERGILYLEDLGASARRFVAPQYTEVNPIEALASSSQSAHPPEAAADGFSNRFWAESATGDGVGQVLSIRFENPVDLDRVGFINGGVEEGEEFISQPRPHQLTLIFSDGTQADIELADDQEFQEFSITARGVDRVDILIEGVYGAVAGSSASISEVTFFRKQ